ncbi:MAG: hypothetical protein MUF00_03905 [Gemmatimonadaceae bacterium]|jgi:hypothetical protein|nr:hypothetical protein [Gemmatimonadaceae bacterium]
MRSRFLLPMLATTIVMGVTGCSDDGPTDNVRAPQAERPATLQYIPPAPARTTTVPSSAVPIDWSIEPGPGTLIAPRVIDAPDTVRVGTPFSVQVYSMAANACVQRVRDEVSTTGNTALIRPIVREDAGAACAQVVSLLAHPVTVTFTTAGRATLQVRGQRIDADGRIAPTDLTAQRTVIVR